MNAKNKSKGKKGRSNRKGAARSNRMLPTMLYKIINPIAQRTNIVVTATNILKANAGSPDITFASGSTFYNISTITSLTDFIDSADSYLYCRISKITVDIVRSSDESTVSANLRGNDIYINYYPNLVGSIVSYADLSRDINSYRVDPMTFDLQKIVCIVPSMINYNLAAGVDYWIDPTKFNLITNLSNILGEIVINTGNTVNNAATLALFTLKMRFYLQFAHRK